MHSARLSLRDLMTADTMHYMLPLCSLAGLAALCDAPSEVSRSMPRENPLYLTSSVAA